MNEREDLKAYLDGELSESRAEEVRLALERDHDLREEYTFMKLLTKEIQSTIKEPEVKGVDGARAAVKRKPWFLKPPALVVQCVAAFFIIGVVGSKIVPRLGARGNVVAAEVSTDRATGRAMPEKAKEALDAAPMEERAPAHSAVEQKAAAPARTPDASPPPLSVPNVTQRDVVKTGSLGVKVKDAKQAMQEMTDTVKAMGGYVESSSVNVTDHDTVGHMALRVPAASFETLVSNVRRMGELMSESLGGQDVTAPLADMGARLRVLRGEEESYVQMLRQSRRLQDTLDLRDRLTNVREEIESIEAQRKALANVAAMSSLNVQLTQPKSDPAFKPGDWFGEATTGATQTLLDVGKTVVSGALYVAILSPVWAPVALVVWLVSRRRKAA